MSGKVSDNIGRGSGSITEPSGGIEILSSDPTLAEGLVWYNSTSNVLKVARTAGTWSSGGNFTASDVGMAGAGTLSAGLCWGGVNGGSKSNRTVEYDGTSWAAGNNFLVTIFYLDGFGIQTAAVSAGGDVVYGAGGDVDSTYEYDGTSWATGGTLSVARVSHGAFGALANAIAMGGNGYIATAEQYDGSSWSNIDSMPVGKSKFSSIGTATAGLAAAGQVTGGGQTNTTYKYGESVTARTVTDS